jgi:hypothetical protein
MALLMTDAAAGGQAALQLQQTMAAAPNVQQVEANKMQEAQVKLQQDQENLSKTKLANIVADTGIKSEAKKQDIVAKWMQDPANKNKSETDMASGLSKAFMMGGLVEDGEKLSQQATLAASKAVLTEQRQLDNNDRELYKAAAVVDAMDVNNITEDFKKLPEQSQKAVLSQIGEPLWNKFSNAEKKAAVYNLLMSGVKRNAAQAIAVDTNKQTLIGDYKVKNTETHEAEATKRRAMGDTAAMERVVVQEDGRTERAEDKERGTQKRFETKEKRLTWNEYSLRNTDIENKGNRVVQNLNKRVQEKAAEIEKLSLGSDSKAQLKANAAWKEAVEERDDAHRKVLQRQYDLALNAPDSFGGKQRVLNSIKNQIELVGKKQDAPKPTPNATSNKLTAEQTATVSKAKAAIKAGADPEKVKERLKQAGIPGY